MKIVFLCSCLEPGRDGVGDYIRRLAVELIRQGHSTAAVSLNDKYVSGSFLGFQSSDGVNFPVLRLSTTLSKKNRFGQTKKYIEDYDPEWLSLQFVIFGYQPKGLPLGLGKQLHGIGKGRKWHIMFHELWLGIEFNASKKHVIWGWCKDN